MASPSRNQPSSREIERSQEFMNLSSYLADVTEDNLYSEKLSPQQAYKLQNLTDAVISMMENKTPTVNVLRVVTQSLNTLSKQKPEIMTKETAKRLTELEMENINLRNRVQNENSTLNNSLNISQHETEKKEIEGALISRIADALALREPNNEKDLIQILSRKINKKNRIVEQIIKEFNLPSTTSSGTLITALQTHILEEIQKFDTGFELEKLTNAEINESIRQELLTVTNNFLTMKQENDELNTQIVQLKSQNHDLKEQFMKIDNKSNSQVDALKSEISRSHNERDQVAKKLEKQIQKTQKYVEKLEEVEVKYSKLRSDYKQLQQQLQNQTKSVSQEESIVMQSPPRIVFGEPELIHYEDSNTQLLQLIETLKTQYEKQCEELATESNARYSLSNIVQKLISVIQILEKECDDGKARLTEAKSKYDLAISKIQHEESLKSKQINENEILQTIKTFENVVPPEIGAIIERTCNNNSMTLSNKISKVFTTITKQQNQEPPRDEKAEAMNKKLIAALCSTLRFIDELCYSEDVQSWMLSSRPFDDTKPILLSQATRIHNFLTENAIGIIEDSSLFDALMMKPNPTNLEQNITKYLKEYQTPNTDEGKMLYLMLAQAIAANDIICKYAVEARMQCARQGTELKSLRYQYSTLQQDTEQQINSQVEPVLAQNAELKDAIEKIRSVIRDAALNGFEPQLLAETLDHIESVSPIENDAYVHELETRLGEMSKQLEKANSRKGKIVQTLSDELKQIQSEMCLLTQEAQEKSEQQLQQIEELRGNLETCESENIDLKEENEELKNKMNQTQIQIEQNNNQAEEYERQVQDITNKYESIISKLKKEASELRSNIQSIQDQSKSEVKQLYLHLTKKIKKLQHELANSSESNKEYQEKIQSLEEHMVELEANTGKSAKSSKEVKELRNKLTNAQVEQKMLEAKLFSQEERLKRDKALFESQMKLKMFALESDCQSKIDQMKSELNSKNHSFLAQVCHLFKEMVDINQPISNESVSLLLERVRHRLDQLCDSIETNSHELYMIKQMLGVPKTSKADSKVSELLALVRNREVQIPESKIVNQDSRSKEWEEWATRINMIVSDGYCTVRSGKELRYVIEEMIFASMGKRLAWIRLDSLRAQKKLLIMGANHTKNRNVPLSMKQAIIIIRAVKRLTKMSGHLQGSLSFERSVQNSNLNQSDTGLNQSIPRTKQPIFGKFIMPS